jgi:hypothetical protein
MTPSPTTAIVAPTTMAICHVSARESSDFLGAGDLAGGIG